VRLRWQLLALWLGTLPLLLAPSVEAAPALARVANELQSRKVAIERDRDALNVDCAQVAATDAARVADCKRRHDDVSQRMARYKADYREYEIALEVVAGERDLYLSIPNEELRILVGTEMLAAKLHWAPEKRARLQKALTELGIDGLDELTPENVRRGWAAIASNSDDPELIRAADAGGKPAPVVAQRGAGDCAIAAVATATGLPYDAVLGQAKDLIRQGEWRDPYTRLEPNAALRKGLNGGEVVMLAESLGRAEVVPSENFVKVLKSGQPILVNTAKLVTERNGFPAPPSLTGHELVLQRTFEHGGKTWIEVANPARSGQRFFVTPQDLQLVIQETGVAYSPEG
jgi:hypothetical protein